MSEGAIALRTVPEAVQNPPIVAPIAGHLAYDVAAIQEQQREVQAFIHDVLVCGLAEEGADYGYVPGIPGILLFKPGAEKFAEFYRVIQRPRITEKNECWEPGALFFQREYELDLIDRATGAIRGTGIGSCNSLEPRYRWRSGGRRCPRCEGAFIIKGKRDFGGGWLCFEKKGGCGAKFRDGDQAIEDQKTGQVPNPDLASCHNPIIKQAKKRALVDGIVSITRSIGLLISAGEEEEDAAVGRGDEKKAEPAVVAPAEPKPAAVIDEVQTRALFDAAKKAKHTFKDVCVWALGTYGVDLSKARLPAAHYQEALARFKVEPAAAEKREPF